MDGSGRVTFVWGDGEHTFRLPFKELRELQEKTNCGPEELMHRINTGKWRVDDIRETIRLGLIGGGMKPPTAHALCTNYVDGRPLLESKLPAYLILINALAGPEDDPLGKAEEGAKSETAAKSPSPSTSEQPSQSGSPSKTSGNARPGNLRARSKATTSTTSPKAAHPSQ